MASKLLDLREAVSLGMSCSNCIENHSRTRVRCQIGCMPQNPDASTRKHVAMPCEAKHRMLGRSYIFDYAPVFLSSGYRTGYSVVLNLAFYVNRTDVALH